VEHPDGIVAGHGATGDGARRDLDLIVVLAERPLLILQGDAADAVGDGQLLAVLLHPHEVAALRLAAVDAAVDEVQLQLEFAAAVVSKAGSPAQLELAAVAADAGAGIGRA